MKKQKTKKTVKEFLLSGKALTKSQQTEGQETTERLTEMQDLYKQIKSEVEDLRQLAYPERGAMVNEDALKRRARAILSLELFRTIDDTLNS